MCAMRHTLLSAYVPNILWNSKEGSGSSYVPIELWKEHHPNPPMIFFLASNFSMSS
jgi:hypothetical protein